MRPVGISRAEIEETAAAHLDWCIECDQDDLTNAWLHEVQGGKDD